MSKQQYLAHMRHAMGGRAAEEVIYGSDNDCNDTSNDFKQATDIAHRMVTKLGMSDLGNVYMSDDNIGSKTHYSEMNKKVEKEIKTLLDNAYHDAKHLLTTNIDSLHNIANALIRYETLDKSQLEKIVRGESID